MALQTLFFGLTHLPYVKNGRGNADGAEASHHNTGHNCERETGKDRTAPDVECKDRHERSDRRVDRSSQSSIDRLIKEPFHSKLRKLAPVLTDAVKDDDGIVK